MKVLVTGARGFIGKNLCQSLKNIRDGKDRRERYKPLLPLEVFECDASSTPDDLEGWCGEADFVFNLAGVNRPKDDSQYLDGNYGFAKTLLETLERKGNTCPVMLSSSIQAGLQGRFAGSKYGESKRAAEELFREYSSRTGAKTLVYRFPNVFGKWCKPHYNSAVATFCNNIAKGQPVFVSDPALELDLLYIDDLVGEMLEALLGNEHMGDDGFCVAAPVCRASLGEIVGLLEGFKDAREKLGVPAAPDGSFAKKLYSTFVSYLPPERLSYRLDSHVDHRGSFTEFLKSPGQGQVSVIVNRPGVTRGQHWHHSKWEKFLVVSGEAAIRLRQVEGSDGAESHEVVEYRVSGDEPTVVEMPPGYSHSITNVSGERELVTLIWANEVFDPGRPDTYYEEV